MNKDRQTDSSEEELLDEEINTSINEKKSKGKITYSKVIKELASTGLYLLCVFALTWLLLTFVGQRTVVDGRSMENTLQNADSLWVDKISYRFNAPKRFDIVVFNPYPNKTEGKKTYYIKRVIGLPGERVMIDADGNIFINGQLLEENYGREIIDTENYKFERALCEEVLLGEDEYFVMGDNRNKSIDSRFNAVGNVSIENVLGKAVFRLYPFNKFGPINNKK